MAFRGGSAFFYNTSSFYDLVSVRLVFFTHYYKNAKMGSQHTPALHCLIICILLFQFSPPKKKWRDGGRNTTSFFYVHYEREGKAKVDTIGGWRERKQCAPTTEL